MKLGAWMLVACGVATSGAMVACGSSDDGSESGTDDAGGPSPDAASPVVDASSPAEASAPDAVSADAGQPDVSVPQDASPSPDASSDAGGEDAGDARTDSGPRELVQCNTPQGIFYGCNGVNQSAEGIGAITFADPGKSGDSICNSGQDIGNCATGDNCVAYHVADQMNYYGTCE